jgi:MFS family permease
VEKEVPAKHDPLAAVRMPEYRNLMAGRFCFIMALRMMGTLVGWWLYELTRDPLAMGLIGLAEVVPALSLALYAGHVIDISEKRKLMLRGVAGYLLCAFTLLLLSSSYLQEGTSKGFLIFSIYLVIFVSGIIRAFTGPTFPAIIGQLVPQHLLPNAITWNQGTWLSASVIGHATAGFCIAAFSHTGTLIVIVSVLAVGLMIMSLLKPKPPMERSGEKKTWDSVMEGVRFVVKTKIILGALSLDLFAVLFGGAVALVPVYAKDILHVGPIGFGWLNAATDIGSILIVIYLALFPLKKNQGKILLFAVAGFGTCIIIFGLSKMFLLSFVILVLAGMLDGISMVVRGTILQLKTPNEMRGRVMSVNSMFINSSNELGQFESGVAARLMGVVSSVVFGGCMTLMVVLITWWKAPSLKKMEY